MKTYFGYNKVYTGITTLAVAAAWIMLIIIACSLSDPGQWIAFIIACIVVFGISRFFILNYTLPMYRNQPALLLDEEKLTHFVSDTIIYWKDVESVGQYGMLDPAYFVFKMKDGGVINIKTKWIEKGNGSVYSSIQGYLTHTAK